MTFLNLHPEEISTGFLFCLLAFPLISHAAIGPNIEELEPNNAPAEATEIVRNLQTPQEVAAGDLSGRRGANGALTLTDSVDYFKVLLYVDKENIWTFGFSSSGNYTVSLQVQDANGESVSPNEFSYTSGGADNAFRVIVPTTGYYYLKVSSLNTVSTEMRYNFTMGNPLYFLTKHVVSFPKVNLGPSLPSFEPQIILTNVPTLHNRSMVYKVNIGGGTTTTTSSRKLQNESNSRWLTALNSIWDCSTPVTNDYILKQPWTVQYNGGSRNATITPEVTFHYVYPKLPLNQQF